METRQPEAPKRIIHQGRVVESIGSVYDRRAHQKDVQSDINSTRETAQKRAKRRRNLATLATVVAFGAAGGVGAAVGKAFNDQHPTDTNTPHTIEAITPIEGVYNVLGHDINLAKLGDKPLKMLNQPIYIGETSGHSMNGQSVGSEVGEVYPIVISVDNKSYYAYFPNEEPNIFVTDTADIVNLMHVQPVAHEIQSNQTVDAHIIAPGVFGADVNGHPFLAGHVSYLSS